MRDHVTPGRVLAVAVTTAGAALALATSALAGQASRTCFGQRATLLGTPGNDRIIGTARRDVIVDPGGNDRIDGRGENDLICAGPGRDRIRGGAGADRIEGGAGRDDADGGPGADVCRTAERLRDCETAGFGNLRLTAGKDLTVPAATTTLEVTGDLFVGRGGAITSQQQRLVVVVSGLVDIRGAVRAAGDLAIVSDPSRIPSRRRLETRTGINSVGRARLGDLTRKAPRATVPRGRWEISGSLIAGDQSLAAGSRLHGLSPGGTGSRGRGLYLDVAGPLALGTAGSAPAATYTAGNGGTGRDRFGCDLVGNRGGRGGPTEIIAEDVMIVRNVQFLGGDGGAGGLTSGAACDTGQRNRGGAGGPPGEIRILVSRGLLRSARFIVTGTMSVGGRNGGVGGLGIARGRDDDPGRSPIGEGGAGGDVRGALRFHGLEARGGAIVVSGFGGGDGANGRGTGGDGDDNLGECDPATAAATRNGASGGDGIGFGGKGGDVNVTFAAGPGVALLTTAFVAGDGGAGFAVGGRGGRGRDCQRRAGDGGKGGDTNVTGGVGGTSNLNPLGGGAPGGVTRTGGTGGRGGDAIPVGGRGGDGGLCGMPGGAGGMGGIGGPPLPGMPGVNQPNCP